VFVPSGEAGVGAGAGASVTCRRVAFNSASPKTLCSAKRPRTGGASAGGDGTSETPKSWREDNAASFSLTSPVHSFRSRRNAFKSRELSRIWDWRLIDIARGEEVGARRESAAQTRVARRDDDFSLTKIYRMRIVSKQISRNAQISPFPTLAVDANLIHVPYNRRTTHITDSKTFASCPKSS
jgi:hypothetical protein